MIEITSPCIRRCCLDNNDVCIGCLRTMDEILQWSQASNSVKSEIMHRVEQRCLQRLSEQQGNESLLQTK
ncbi:MAG: DUF1289 domain-containing protein [Gammaproteobacteria bacterium]|nr:DUF1289 domain-containing protein [Gammaproteobacteria bacterium]